MLQSLLGLKIKLERLRRTFREYPSGGTEISYWAERSKVCHCDDSILRGRIVNNHFQKTENVEESMNSSLLLPNTHLFLFHMTGNS